jgi:hypothetical protein
MIIIHNSSSSLTLFYNRVIMLFIFMNFSLYIQIKDFSPRSCSRLLLPSFLSSSLSLSLSLFSLLLSPGNLSESPETIIIQKQSQSRNNHHPSLLFFFPPLLRSCCSAFSCLRAALPALMAKSCLRR